MNVIDLLSADHRRVEQLFGEFAETSDEETARRICNELTLHSDIEERIVYPELRRIDEELTEESVQEHTEARELIEEIRSADADAVVDLMEQLEAAIEHHVGEEESEAFPKLQTVGAQRLEDMGTEAEQMKRSRNAA